MIHTMVNIAVRGPIGDLCGFLHIINFLIFIVYQ